MNAKDLYKELDITLGDLNVIAALFGESFGSWNTKIEDTVLINKIRASHKANGVPAAAPEAPAKAGAAAVAAAAPAKKKAKSKAKAKVNKTPFGYEPEALKSLAATLKIDLDLEKLDEVKDEDKARLENCRSAIKLAEDLGTTFEVLQRIGARLGIEIGRVGFNGLSGPETFLLKAQYRTEFGGQNPTLIKAAEEVATPTFAEPTGNKAKEVIEPRPAREVRGKGERTGRQGGREAQANKPAGPSFPPVDRGRGGAGQVGSGRRTGRKRFEVKDTSYASQRRGAGRDRVEDGQQAKRFDMPAGPVTVALPITLRQLSESLGVKVNDIMGHLMREGLMIRIQDSLSAEMVENIGILLEREIIVRAPKSAEELIEAELDKFEDSSENLLPRAPIVTVMGHVDHGKTSLLDAINKMDRAGGEAGGITQHIGAFRVEMALEDGTTRVVTFIDTPGHAAFTEMRARGARVTDVAVIVVAADDAVMPQTIEAISHARAAKVQIVVAINKIDKPDANIMRTRQMLAELNLMSPDWGGETEIVEVSATRGTGVQDLIAVLADLTELLELKANPNKPAVGTVLEANRDEGRGNVATIVVQEGTLAKGQAIVAGHGYGRVRAMYNSRGKELETAGPSVPVEVTGLSELPEVGSRFHGVEDLKKATAIAAKVLQQEKQLAASRADRPVTLEQWSAERANRETTELLLVIKTDVQGTARTIESELSKFSHEEVAVKVLYSAPGSVTSNDVRLAEASGAIILGFNTTVQPKAQELADNHHIQIRQYDVIYKLLEDITEALSGLLKPEEVEVELGEVEVRQIFKASKIGIIAGCYVTQGTITRNARVRLYRDGKRLFDGALDSLKRFNDEVKEVREGFECGIVLSRHKDIAEGDIMRAYVIEERERTLS